MSSISQKRFIKEALDAHNKYRKVHGVSELEHDTKLSDLAMDWAEHLANRNTLEYTNSQYENAPLGENVVKANKFYLNGDLISKIWYDENSKYHYDGAFTPTTGHFTQMVWKNTRKVGFGYASRDDGQFFAVAFYYPAGNYKNEFKENVLPLVSKEIKTQKKDDSKVKEAKPISNIISKVLPIKESSTSVKEEPRNVVPKYSQFSDAQQRFISEALATHNSCRQRHCVEPLVHNPELSKIAQQYANQLAKSKSLIHSQNRYQDKNLGENLAYSYDSTLNYYSGEKATMQWYDEIKKHNFDLDYQKGTGHFTQLVWKASKEVGFGVAMASDGSFYAVANYFPAGNLLGTFAKNVPKPL